MLRWALIFLAIAIVSAIFGFSAAAGVAAEIAKILFYIFVAFFLVFLGLGVFAVEKVRGWMERP